MTPPDQFPLELADRCVKCGLCLPHCPTYLLGEVEGESPRGRIALMQGLATGRLEAGPALVRHLEQCLGCRACEAVCPANVPYGELIDAGRALLLDHGVQPAMTRRMLGGVLQRRRLLGLALRLARLPGIATIGRKLGGMPGRALALLPPEARPVRSRPGPGPEQAEARRREVLLFAGCVGAALDGRTLEDTRAVLEAGGWRVRMPPRQACCGAIDLHAGRVDAARTLAARNVQAFARDGPAGNGPIVACATGCAATLLEYARLAGEAGASFAARIRDPAELLAGAQLKLRPGRYRRIVLHLPCTQRNVTGTAAATRRLLGRIPGLEVRELATGCCGAAGEMFLSHPALSDALLAPWLAQLEQDPPDALVTGNIGCAMHFAAGLRRRALAVPVLHPCSLVAGALE
jgi:glycolate oxidase iron-sulfur subunit